MYVDNGGGIGVRGVGGLWGRLPVVVPPPRHKNKNKYTNSKAVTPSRCRCTWTIRIKDKFKTKKVLGWKRTNPTIRLSTESPTSIEKIKRNLKPPPFLLSHSLAWPDKRLFYSRNKHIGKAFYPCSLINAQAKATRRSCVPSPLGFWGKTTPKNPKSRV